MEKAKIRQKAEKIVDRVKRVKNRINTEPYLSHKSSVSSTSTDLTSTYQPKTSEGGSENVKL